MSLEANAALINMAAGLKSTKEAAKERRERIATAVLAGLCHTVFNPKTQQPMSINAEAASKHALVVADALIAELDK